MIGAELVKDDSAPDAALRDAVVQACFRRGLLVLGCGESSVRFSPPLIINHDHVNTATRIFEEALTEVEAARPSARDKTSVA
jgi:4-aminobutyrate aminotransferase